MVTPRSNFLIKVMLQKNKFWLASFAIFIMTLPVMVWGADAVTGIDIPTTAETGLTSQLIYPIVDKFFSWLLSVIGIVALISFVISGAIYIMSSGDDKTVEKAKNAMKNSIIGIIIVLGSFVILQFIDTMLR